MLQKHVRLIFRHDSFNDNVIRVFRAVLPVEIEHVESCVGNIYSQYSGKTFRPSIPIPFVV